MRDGNGNGWPTIKKSAVVGVPLTAIAGMVVAAYINLSNQTAVAIQVARDHGGELKLLRSDYTQLHGELQGLRASIDMGTRDRFYRQDADRLEARILERLRIIEARIENVER